MWRLFTAFAQLQSQPHVKKVIAEVMNAHLRITMMQRSARRQPPGPPLQRRAALEATISRITQCGMCLLFRGLQIGFEAWRTDVS
jgi:hypothetical protein